MTTHVLTIAGTDPTGAAGIQVDLQVFRDFGVHGLSVITAVVAQNTQEVQQFTAMTGASVAAQLNALRDDGIAIGAIKVGMIPEADAVLAVCEFAESLGVPMVVDPVLKSGSGNVVLSNTTLDAHLQLMKLAHVVTPNIPEAVQFTGPHTDVLELADAMQKLVGASVLLKGGHRLNEDDEIVDIWCDEDGPRKLKALQTIDEDVRGTGCQLSSAIAAALALGHKPETAAVLARGYLNDLLLHNRSRIGRGRAVIIRVDDD